jgi:hypothetical protein
MAVVKAMSNNCKKTYLIQFRTYLFGEALHSGRKLREP